MKLNPQQTIEMYNSQDNPNEEGKREMIIDIVDAMPIADIEWLLIIFKRKYNSPQTKPRGEVAKPNAGGHDSLRNGDKTVDTNTQLK